MSSAGMDCGLWGQRQWEGWNWCSRCLESHFKPMLCLKFFVKTLSDPNLGNGPRQKNPRKADWSFAGGGGGSGGVQAVGGISRVMKPLIFPLCFLGRVPSSQVVLSSR